jgi:hypothetical protein
MILLNRVETELESLKRRIAIRLEAEEWASGEFDFIPYELLPKMPNDQAEADARRLAKMAQSLGTRVMSVKKFLTLGNVNWGGNSGGIDERLEQQDLDQLSSDLLEQGLISGIMAGIVRRSPLDGRSSEPNIEPLYGHIEPIYDLNNPNRISALYQCWKDIDVRIKGWQVRIYDFDAMQILRWQSLDEPYMLGKSYVIESEGQSAPMPRYKILRKVMVQLHPLFHSNDSG